MIIQGNMAEKEAVIRVAQEMCAAARTAPKAKGTDYIKTAVVLGRELEDLADQMVLLGNKSGMGFMIRDAGNIRNSDAVVLIGTSYGQRGLTELCSLCNFAGCEQSKANGAVCIYYPLDLGIALGSAVSIAADNRIDNRIMFSAGKAALKLGYLGEGINCIMAIPLSVKGKNIFVDRK